MGFPLQLQEGPAEITVSKKETLVSFASVSNNGNTIQLLIQKDKYNLKCFLVKIHQQFHLNIKLHYYMYLCAAQFLAVRYQCISNFISLASRFLAEEVLPCFIDVVFSQIIFSSCFVSQVITYTRKVKVTSPARGTM